MLKVGLIKYIFFYLLVKFREMGVNMLVFWVKMFKFECYWVKMLNLLVKLGSY